MEKTPAEKMKEYVNSQRFESTADIMTAMKEMFADVIEQIMECELGEKLGYEKSRRIAEDDEIKSLYRGKIVKRIIATATRKSV